MTSYSGSVAYLKYVSKTNKGAIAQGDEFNSVFGLGLGLSAEKAADRVNFTSQAVTEAAAAGTGAQALAWEPLVHGAFTDNNVKYDVKLVTSGVANPTYAFYKEADQKFYSDAACTTQITVAANTKVAYKYNQEYTPANDIPTIGPKMERIALVAEPRRIAVRYDQITAFQA